MLDLLKVILISMLIEKEVRRFSVELSHSPGCLFDLSDPELVSRSALFKANPSARA